MPTVTVYHSQNELLNGGYTEFSGPHIEYSVDENGLLSVWKWQYEGKKGRAIFATGQWSAVIESCPVTDE